MRRAARRVLFFPDAPGLPPLNIRRLLLRRTASDVPIAPGPIAHRSIGWVRRPIWGAWGLGVDGWIGYVRGGRLEGGRKESAEGSGARGPLPIRVGTCGWWCVSGRIKRKLEYLGGWIGSVLPPRVWLLGLEARVLAALFSSFLCRRFVLVRLYITAMVYMHVSRSIDRSMSRLIGWFVGRWVALSPVILRL